MPHEDEYIYKTKERQFEKEIRVSSDYHADELKKKNKTLFDQNAIRKDIQQIDLMLQMKQSEEDRARLEMIQGRNISSLLILEEKTTGDSSQMKNVKKSVSAVEVEINRDRLGEPFTVKDMDQILDLYDTAIHACKNYVSGKNPTYKKGKERLNLVQMNLTRLIMEAETFLVAKELLRSGILDAEANQARILMMQAKTYGLVNGNRLPEGVDRQQELPNEEKQQQKLPQKEGVADWDKETALIYGVLSGREMPADAINRLLKSKDEKDKKLGQELLMFIGNVRSSIADFKEGKVQAKIFMIGNTVINVHQNFFGMLSIHVGGRELPLNRHTGILRDVLMTDTVKNEELYGKKDADSVIRDIIKKMDLRNPGAENRQILTDYLVKHTIYSATDYANFLTTDLAHMIRCLLAGKKMYILDSEYDMDWELSPNDVIFTKNHNSLINVMEARELLKDTREEKNREKVKKSVEVKRPEEKNQKEEKNPEEKEKTEWDEKEQKVINLMGDVIFSYETWTADEKIQEPGKRMQLMLLKNVDALAYLISDMFTQGELNLKMINGMLDKLPLFMLEPKEAEELKKTLIGSLSDAMNAIKGVVDKKSIEVIGERPEGFGGFLYDTKKALITMNAMGHLASHDNLLKGIQIPETDIKVDGLADIIRTLDDNTVKMLANAENMIDQGVNAASGMIQKSVSKYSGELFKQEKKVYEALPDPNAPGLSPEQVKEAKKQRYIEGNRRLGDMVKDSMTSGENGQGLFTKIVFEKYFQGVDTMDKRSMLASMIRNAKPAGKLLDENEKGLSEAEIKSRKEKNEKIRTESMGNYIGGLLKGAGPLFQKMMQGLPMEGLPRELQSAVKDMKSRLAPIPDEIVEAQLYNMVQRSHGQVKNIKVVKPLGAATVGQTFLCRITRADGKEEEAAIKLLKPDVTNRMMREKELMIRCARETDIQSRRNENLKRSAENKKLLPEIGEREKGGMQVTYEGQLERIQEELDLTIEARNVELGKIYDKAKNEEEEKVSAMKLSTVIAPTTTSMVLEKAPGETIDNLLERVKEETNRLKNLYQRKVLPGMPEETKKKIERSLEAGEEYYSNPIQVAMDQDFEIESEEFANLQPARIEEKLAALLAELKKKKEYLDTYARKWTEEGLFQDGFYHGDPHDGNIMVSDDKLTVIDFGNCTKLSGDQQGHVTRMVAAAATGDMELFRSGLHALLKPEFENLYQEKREELGKAIKAVFKMGDQRSAGARIMVALLKAQELGLEVPSSVYNFSQGQIRLQNTLSNMNNQIDELEKAIAMYTEKTGESPAFDFTEDFRDQVIEVYRRYDEFPSEEYHKSLCHAYFKQTLIFANDPALIENLAEEHFDEFKRGFIIPLKTQAAAKDSIIQDIREVVETRKTMNPEFLEEQRWDLLVHTRFNTVGDIVTDELQNSLQKRLEDGNLTDEWVEGFIHEIRQRIAGVEEAVEYFDRINAIREDVKSNHKGVFKPNEEEKAMLHDSCDSFAKVYTPIHVKMAEGNGVFEKHFRKWTNPDNIKEMRPRMEGFFMVYPAHREEFMEAYHAFMKARDEKLDEKDEAKFLELRNNLKKIYHEIMLERLRKKESDEEEIAHRDKTDFLDIMADVLDEQVESVVGRMGFFRSISMKWKLNRQKKEQVELGLAKG